MTAPPNPMWWNGDGWTAHRTPTFQKVERPLLPLFTITLHGDTMEEIDRVYREARETILSQRGLHMREL